MKLKTGSEPAVALLPAAGRGLRFGGDTAKQYLTIAGRSLLEWSLLALKTAGCDRALIGVRAGQEAAVRQSIGAMAGFEVAVCAGGASRAETVQQLLRHLCARQGERRWVLVHDAVRPCLSPGLVRRLMRQVQSRAAAAPDTPIGGALAMPVDAALRRAEPGGAPGRDSVRLVQCLERDDLWLMQTPQMYRAGELMRSLDRWRLDPAALEDESRAFVADGGQVLIVPGSAANLKVTRSEDLALAGSLLSACRTPAAGV